MDEGRLEQELHVIPGEGAFQRTTDDAFAPLAFSELSPSFQPVTYLTQADKACNFEAPSYSALRCFLEFF